MLVPQTRYAVRSDGLRIGYQIVGDGPVDLLVVPGFMSHLDLQWIDPTFASFLERFASISRLILYDRPGCGVSDPLSSAPSPDEHVRDIETVLDAAGSSETILWGFSEGSGAALLFAATRPERTRAVMTWGGYIKIPVTQEAKVAALFGLLEHWGEGRSADLFCPSIADGPRRRFWAMFERAAYSPARFELALQAAAVIDLADVARHVKVPAMVMHRNRDFVDIEGGRELARLVPGAQFVEFDGDDHAFWVGDSDPIFEEVEAFLAGLEPGGGAHEEVMATVLAVRGGEVSSTQVERHGGHVLSAAGGESIAVFGHALDAIRCAHALHDGGEILAAGVHTGACAIHDRHIRGPVVEGARDTVAAALAGETLVTAPVKEIATGLGLEFTVQGDRGTAHDVFTVVAGARPLGEAARPFRRDQAVVALARRAPKVLRAVARMVPAGGTAAVPGREQPTAGDHLIVCGELGGRLSGRAIGSELRGTHLRVLFAYLLLHRDGPVSRSAAGAAVWPDVLPGHPDAALRTLLSRLRRVVGAHIIATDGGGLTLRLPPSATVDLDLADSHLAAATAALGAGDHQQALHDGRQAADILARGLLTDIEGATWLDALRARVHDDEQRALEIHVDAALAIGGTALPQALSAARRLVTHSPYSETATIRLMRALEANGDLAEALRTYDALRVRLRDELGIAPSVETRELHSRLLAET